LVRWITEEKGRCNWLRIVAIVMNCAKRSGSATRETDVASSVSGNRNIFVKSKVRELQPDVGYLQEKYH
jgi:hypothetical protein